MGKTKKAAKKTQAKQPQPQPHGHHHQHSQECCHSHDANTGMPVEGDQEREEEEHFKSILISFLEFTRSSHIVVEKGRNHFSRLPPHQRALVPDYEAKIGVLHDAVRENDAFIRRVVSTNWGVFGGLGLPQQDSDYAVLKSTLSPNNRRLSESEYYIDKVRSTFASIARDWSSEGAAERRICYGPLLEALEKRWPTPESREGVRVLTPGAGLGRLTYEVARMGFSSQGNEFSFFMLIVSSFILNNTQRAEEFTIHPYVRGSLNLLSAADRPRAIKIPDVCPGEADSGRMDMSMTAGDFLEVYTSEENEAQWGAVVSAFFIDTAHNIFDYIDAIRYMIKPGGIWVNLGPLLYHFSDMADEFSVDLAWDEVRAAIEKSGFKIKEERIIEGCPYTANVRSLFQVRYNCIYFVAERDDSPAPRPTPMIFN